MADLFANFQAGTITNNPLLIGGTTVNSAAFANLPVVSGTDVMYITLDPDASAGAPEIVKVTAHTASATSVTVERAQMGTTARQHANATVWRHSVYASQLASFPANGPKGRTAYASTSSPQSSISSTGADLTGLTVTFTAVSGRRYKITGYVPGAKPGTIGENMKVTLQDGTTVLQSANTPSVSGADEAVSLVVVHYLAGDGASKTLKLVGAPSSGSAGALVYTNGGYSFLLVEDIGT